MKILRKCSLSEAECRLLCNCNNERPLLARNGVLPLFTSSRGRHSLFVGVIIITFLTLSLLKNKLRRVINEVNDESRALHGGRKKGCLRSKSFTVYTHRVGFLLDHGIDGLLVRPINSS